MVITCMKLARAPLTSTSQISAMKPGANMLKAPAKPVRKRPQYKMWTLEAVMRQTQPQNIGTDRIIIVHFFPYFGISQPAVTMVERAARG